MMGILRSLRHAAVSRGGFWAVLSALVITSLPTHAAEPPARLKRADSFLGIHFDFHAGADCNEVGRRTTPEMVELVIDKVQPDYIQIDCKGHPGYSSYPTRVGNPAPGFVGDPLRVWRDATRRRGVALFMHYSGVWDRHAVATHPEWAAVRADGKPDENATSVFGPYADTLMIPQLRELAGDYGVDGAWVDGDCWGAAVDYRDRAASEFCRQSGAKSAPRKSSEPFWQEWLTFQREGYRRYLRHYVNQLKASHPDFQIVSNWAFSDHMPEPVSAGVAALSGDFSPDNSVNSARFSGRCLENQPVAWDLMSWSFGRKTRSQKPAAQLMQEAAVVLALGGGYQAYFKQDRDGAIRPAEMDTMAEVARFCRQRQAFCHRSVAVPQVALLYSTAGHYRSSSRLFHPSGSDGIDVLKKALGLMLGRQYAVQIVSEHHLAGAMSRWPLIVVPGWGYLEPAFRDELAAYANSGGRLLLIGSGPAKLFQRELAVGGGDGNAPIVSVAEAGDGLLGALENMFPDPLVRVSGSTQVDVSPRRLGGKLMIHLVNTAGPHADAPKGGITAVPPVGPLSVSVRLARAPKSVTCQPEGTPLEVSWSAGRAAVELPRLELYSILVVEQ
ncbi:MAG: alpha-amylase family protein [Thermoguttaceae bacterium]|jgi:hypothetical protein